MITKKQAAEKVAKLRRVYERPDSGPEGQTARRSAEKLILEHSLTEADLSIGAKVAAFDDLVGQLEIYAKGNQDKLPGSVADAIDKIKNHTKEEDKAEALDKIVGWSKVSALLFGHNKYVRAVKDTIENVLKKHDVKI